MAARETVLCTPLRTAMSNYADLSWIELRARQHGTHHGGAELGRRYRLQASSMCPP
jgi:hypothetical protein